MRPTQFFLLAALFALLFPSTCFSRSSSPQNDPASRNDYVVSVQELTMPRKAVHAFQKGTALLLKGNAQASLPYFRAVIEEVPSYYRPYQNLGLAYYLLGQSDAAVQAFQKAIDLTNGAFAPSFFGLSMVLYQRGEFSQAESLIQKGLLVSPNSDIGKYCLALVQFSLGRLPESERSAHDALALDPTQTDAYLLLAHIHERLHDPSSVLADVHTYLRLTHKGPLRAEAFDLLHRAQQAISSQPTQSAALR